MKNNSLKYIVKTSLAFLGLVLILLSSCGKEEDTAPPTIERIRVTLKDSTISTIASNNTIAIIGAHLSTTQRVLFNDYPAELNPSYIKDDVIVIQVPEDAPYRNTINKIKVISPYGEAVKDFSITQPEPTITSFAPQAGNEGEIVTIIGKDLDNVKTVFIGSDSTPVKIVAGSTDTQLKFIVPAGNPAGQITVVTVGGEVKSATSFGVSFIIYNDFMASGWDPYGTDADYDTESKERVKKGKSIKVSYNKKESFFAFGITNGVDVKKYIAIKMAIYIEGTEPETKIKAGVVSADNTTNAFSKIIVLKPGWNDVILDFIMDLNKPTLLKEFRLEEWNNVKLPVIHIDDIGVL